MQNALFSSKSPSVLDLLSWFGMGDLTAFGFLTLTAENLSVIFLIIGSVFVRVLMSFSWNKSQSSIV